MNAHLIYMEFYVFFKKILPLYGMHAFKQRVKIGRGKGGRLQVNSVRRAQTQIGPEQFFFGAVKQHPAGSIAPHRVTELFYFVCKNLFGADRTQGGKCCH